MKLLTRIPGKEYFISLFIIGAAVLITFSIIIYRHYDDASKFNQWVLVDYEIARQARLLESNLLNMETSVRGYLLTRDPSFLDTYNQAAPMIAKQLDYFRQLSTQEGYPPNVFDAWRTRSEAFRRLLATQIKEGPDYDRAETTQALREQKAQMDVLRRLIETSIVYRVQNLNLQLGAVRNKANEFLWILIAGTALAITAMFLVTTAIIGLIARGHRARHEIELAEERFRAVMAGINDGIYDYHPLEKRVEYSDALRSMVGYTEEEFPNSLESTNRYIHPDDLKAAWDMIDRYERHEIPHYACTFRMLHKDGSWRWILSRGVGFWNEKGQFSRMIGIHSDITEHKKREEELEALNSELETYTYIASHDLRSPLVNIKGFARELEFSLDKIKPIIAHFEPSLSTQERAVLAQAFDSEIPEALGFILKSVQRMDNLTTAVLDLSRIGKREYQRVFVDVNALVKKCVDAQAYEITQNNIEVTLQNLPPIYSDPLALEQIFSNLIDNAVKYMQPGRPGKISIFATRTPTDITYTIEDNGRGIDNADFPKIFEIFRRARNTENVRGLGMGMAFVRATVRKLSGTIWCSSTVNVGTTFFIRLPSSLLQETV